MIKKATGEWTWDEVPIHPYKEDGTHFKSITRQTLFAGANDVDVECRYFEMAADGHSTLERHQHQHIVMVLRGSGEVLVGDTVSPIGPQDLVHIPPMTWHQFRATRGEPLGFLCIVSNQRDKPQRPTAEDVTQLKQNPAVGGFIRT